VAVVRGVRKEVAHRCRSTYTSEPSPIRVMARMVREAQEAALKAGVSREVLDREVVNRTIGDVNVRWITENIGGVDYSTIGEDLGLIIPGEHIAGRVSDGRMRLEMERREEEIELRLLRDYGWDMRTYDLFGVGNPLLRDKLAARFNKAWGIPTHPDMTFISIGALDALYKSLLSLGLLFKRKYGTAPTF